MHAAGDALDHRVEPDIRPLFRPQRPRRVGAVTLRVLRNDLSVRVAEQRLGALRADVDADDEICAHASGSTLLGTPRHSRVSASFLAYAGLARSRSSRATGMMR